VPEINIRFFCISRSLGRNLKHVSRSWISKVPPTIYMLLIYTSQTQRINSRGHLTQSASQMVGLNKKLVTASYRIQQSGSLEEFHKWYPNCSKYSDKKYARVSCNYLDGKATRKPNWMTSNSFIDHIKFLGSSQFR
jgi:hypothetical protein